ncbi:MULTISPECIES: hypothetical protein [Campylobacter]|uniref:hypothetical protein n=1 Tax=Campylobacter TaxID=194 RepID=UPI000A32FADA|nr:MULTISPECIES: hypothetical protein [unclassified Campylobacter]
MPNSGEVIKQSKNSSIIELAQLSKDTNDRINRALHSSMPKAKISILSKYDNRMRYVRGGVAICNYNI